MTKRERHHARRAAPGEAQKEGPDASIGVPAWDPIIVCGGGSEFQIVSQPTPEHKPNPGASES
jgi:hypothetical protein